MARRAMNNPDNQPVEPTLPRHMSELDEEEWRRRMGVGTRNVEQPVPPPPTDTKPARLPDITAAVAVLETVVELAKDKDDLQSKTYKFLVERALLLLEPERQN